MPWGSTRGPKWHGKGWRDRDTGEMYINLKHSWAAHEFQREHEVDPRMSISDLIDELRYTTLEGDCCIKRGMRLKLFFRKRPLKRSDRSARTIFDGGETVYAKVFDSEGRELRNDYREWSVRPRGARIDVSGV